MPLASLVAEKIAENERLLEIIQVQNEIAAADLDLDTAMGLIAERACTLTEADAARIAGGGLGRARRPGDEPQRQAPARRARAAGRGPLAGTLAGTALRERRILVSEDCENEFIRNAAK